MRSSVADSNPAPSGPMPLGPTSTGPTPQVPLSLAKPAGRRWLRRGLTLAIITYTASLIVLYLWMRWYGDRQWLATLFLFGPRWICALPLPVLAVGAAIWHRKALGLLMVAGLVIVGPIMGFQLNLASSGPGTLRIMTCNVDQYSYRAVELEELIEREQPDIVALQEVPGRAEFLWPSGWHVVHRDEYVVASRYPVHEQEHVARPTVPGKLAAMRFTVQLPDREVQIFNLHSPTPRPGLEAVLDRRTGLDMGQVGTLEEVLRIRAEESQLVSDWVASFPGPKIVVGDFNMPIESGIFRDAWSPLKNAFAMEIGRAHV